MRLKVYFVCHLGVFDMTTATEKGTSLSQSHVHVAVSKAVSEWRLFQSHSRIYNGFTDHVQKCMYGYVYPVIK